MRWLADECVEAALVGRLRRESHDVSYVAEIAAGLGDTDALRLAVNEERLFLTEDKDFGELVIRFRLAVPGLVLLRIPAQRPELRWPRLQSAIAKFGDRLFGRFVVVGQIQLRARSLPRPEALNTNIPRTPA